MKEIADYFSINREVDLDFFGKNIEKFKEYILEVKKTSNSAELDLAKLLVSAILNNEIEVVTTICKADVIAVDKYYPGLGVPFHHACLNAGNGRVPILAILLDYSALSVMNLPIPERDNLNALEASLKDKKYQNVLFLLLSGANPFMSKTHFGNVFAMASELANHHQINQNFVDLLSYIKIIEEILTPALIQIFQSVPDGLTIEASIENNQSDLLEFLLSEGLMRLLFYM